MNFIKRLMKPLAIMENKETLKAIRDEMEAFLLQDERFAALILDEKKAKLEAAEKAEKTETLSQVAGVIRVAAERLSEVQEKGEQNTKSIAKEVTEALSNVSTSIETALNARDAALIENMGAIVAKITKLAERKQAAPNIKVQSPSIVIPEPVIIDKTVTVKDSSEVTALLTNLIEAITEQNGELANLTQQTRVRNTKATEAIPVTLTDRDGRTFIDFKDMAKTLKAMGLGGASQLMASAGGSGNGTPFNVFDEDVSVPSSVETTVVSYVIPGDVPAYIGGAIVSCGSAVKFKLKVNGTVKAVGRTTASHPTENIQFGNGAIRVSAGDTVIITAYHVEIADQIVDANLYGTL